MFSIASGPYCSFTVYLVFEANEQIVNTIEKGEDSNNINHADYVLQAYMDDTACSIENWTSQKRSIFLVQSSLLWNVLYAGPGRGLDYFLFSKKKKIIVK